MKETEILNLLHAMDFSPSVQRITPFCREEDHTPYEVWKVETDIGIYVLKKTTSEEQTAYETFLQDCPYAPRVYGFSRHQNELYMLMEYVPGETLSQCSRQKLTLALDALIAGQEQYWENSTLKDVGYSYRQGYAERKKRLARLASMDELSRCYAAYLEEYAQLPRTLCNDDMLPFNLVVGADRAVILDWEYAGILPYPGPLARFLAFGEENPNSLFQMTPEDKAFALEYYYENLIRSKGISKAAYERTMKLFFFAEYCEWVCLAVSSGDFTSPKYKKYAPLAQKLARELFP